MKKLLIVIGLTMLTSLSSFALIGGSKGRQIDFPEQVRINDDMSGTVIGKRLILTSAHGLYNSNGYRRRKYFSREVMTIRSHYLGRVRKVRIRKIHIFPQYDKEIRSGKSPVLAATIAPDLAIIEVDFLRDIPEAAIQYLQPEVGDTLIVTGSGCFADNGRLGPFKFGATSVIDIPKTSGSGSGVMVTQELILSDGSETRVCAGDSGGGLYSGQYLIGVNSIRGKSNGMFVNGHVNLFQVKEWIEKIAVE